MSQFWSGWVIIFTVANILGCYWLIKWSSKRRAGEAAQGEVTGHKWDETLEEYNNPLPLWWLWLFYITIIFGLIYLVLYPGLGNFAGKLGWTQKGQYETEMKQADAKYGPLFAHYAVQDIDQLAKDSKALKVGQRLFLNYCATCHGSDAGGASGFPNLTDKDWLWGSSPNAIKQSILNGRMGVMPAHGHLGEKAIDDVANYVISLSGRSIDAAAATAGKTTFDTVCAVCHGADGKGNTALGAPNLTDNTWLYGGSKDIIKESISMGRNGQMPANKDFLGEDKVHLLAAYVYSLSTDKR